jgi:hypothetical protein
VRRAWLVVAVTVGIATGASACFELPADDVTFSCDPATAAECPDGYRCEDDGCCHRVGSDVEATLGACALGGGSTDDTDDTSGSDSDG